MHGQSHMYVLRGGDEGSWVFSVKILQMQCAKIGAEISNKRDIESRQASYWVGRTTNAVTEVSI